MKISVWGVDYKTVGAQSLKGSAPEWSSTFQKVVFLCGALKFLGTLAGDLPSKAIFQQRASLMSSLISSFLFALENEDHLKNQDNLINEADFKN